MSQPTVSEGFTAYSRPTDPPKVVSNSVSVALQSRVSPRNPAQSVLNNAIIPRDYLSSLSKPHSKVGDSTPYYPQPSGSASEFEHPPTVSTYSGDQAERNNPSPDSSAAAGPPGQIEEHYQSIQPPSLKIAKRKPQPSDVDQTLNNFPDSPKSFASSNASELLKPMMPRTSSIDSAISSISNSSWPVKQSSDTRDPSSSEIRNLIATAGSSESLILHLLRDKSQAAFQNAQLWKLVDKQRALLLGLTKDLERMTKERDRYRKKAKDLQSEDTHQRENQLTPTTPDLYGQPKASDGIGAAQHSVGNVAAASDRKTDQRSNGPYDQAMMPSPLQPLHQPPSIERPSEKFNNPPTDVPAITEISAPAQSQGQPRPQPPKLQSLTTTHLAQPTFSLIEATPLAESPAKSLAANRKAPPKPLDLKQTKEDLNISQFPKSDVVVGSTSGAVAPLGQERGRRKTREEDDKDRQLAVVEEQEARSRSKKEKRSKEEQTSSEHNLTPAAFQQRPQTPQSDQVAREQLSPPVASAMGSLQPESGRERFLSAPLRSPGLPASPRPADRPVASTLPAFMKESQPPANSLPMSPRGNFSLSPRAPKQPLPQPTSLHPGTAPIQMNRDTTPLLQTDTIGEFDRLHIHESPLSPSDIPPVYRGLVNPTWPDLLLPPNAIPSIQIKVASSRLKPSRNSVFGLKMSDDSTVFSLSVFSRSSRNELWRIEKIPAALPFLEQQLRPTCPNLPRLPDRKLFSGHSPATVDARRSAIDNYFDELLDTQIDEQAALLICKFLSTDVLDPATDATARLNQKTANFGYGANDGKPIKTGYLTKKGKNFGGWKSRFFVVDSPELRYFEAPGGAHLGTIKLLNARIGRQTQNDGAAYDENESDGQFRHAFLVLEPKRKDSNSYVRHVLCAENDIERDEWVQALLHFVNEKGSATNNAAEISNPRTMLRGTDYGDAMTESTLKSSSPIPGQGYSGSASPTSSNSATLDIPAQDAGPTKTANISRPMNGTVISDAGMWGNKQVPQSPPKERDQKIRNLFHFNRKPSHEQLAANNGMVEDRPRTGIRAKSRGYVRPVFGLSLAEAVEYCPPDDVDILLPAVVYRCIEYLRAQNAANEEGLFRLSGSNVVIRTLKERFNTEGDIDLVTAEEYYDVHAVASLFKTYLRELPSTLLTRELHLDFLRVLELENKDQKITAFNDLVHRLPSVNYSLLRTLSQYLLEVVQNSDKNKMTVKNVGIVFSPTLNIPAPVFSMFLTDFDAIFNERPSERHPIDQPDVSRSQSVHEGEVRTPAHLQYADVSRTNPYQNIAPNPTTPSRAASDATRGTNYYADPNNDYGFLPVQASYESGQYVSVPSQNIPQPSSFPVASGNSRGPTYRMMAPDNNSNEKAKRRESAMLFLG